MNYKVSFEISLCNLVEVSFRIDRASRIIFGNKTHTNLNEENNFCNFINLSHSLNFFSCEILQVRILVTCHFVVFIRIVVKVVSQCGIKGV